MSFLAALAKKNRGKIPIWLMRQAGRYLPEYRQLKQQRSLFEMFHDVPTIVSVTKLPFKRLALDAAIIFSDILTVLDGLGVDYSFEEKIGPLINFSAINPKKGAYRHIQQAIYELKHSLHVPLIGFAGAPFTIASYLIEGRTTKQFLKAKRFLFEHPQKFAELVQQVTEETCRYLDVQIQAGVDVVQLFDSWAHYLAPTEFEAFALAPLKLIIDHVKAQGVPIIIFSKAACAHAKELAKLQPTAISFDWSGHLPTIRQQLPDMVLQGNLDPSVLFGSEQQITQAVDRMLDPFLLDPAFIFNLGHGVLPDTPVENVQFLIEYVNYRSQSYCQAT